jgi:hypothetical protein
MRDPHSENEQGPLYHGTPVEIQFEHGVAKGAAFFDYQPHFPCFALFLDPTYSLVLKARDMAEKLYERIGIAKFIRSTGQRRTMPEAYGTLDNPMGPVSDQDSRTTVTIF